VLGEEYELKEIIVNSVSKSCEEKGENIKVHLKLNEYLLISILL
jgi:hypothetical protein